jgi:hypothetical protein
MFVDSITDDYPWPVTVFVADNGRAEKRQLVLKFKRFTTEELQRLGRGPDKQSDVDLLDSIQAVFLERPDTTDESAADAVMKIVRLVGAQSRNGPSNEWLFPQIVSGWVKVMEEDKVTEKPFSWPALQALLSKYNCWTEVAFAWTESLKVGKTKN